MLCMYVTLCMLRVRNLLFIYLINYLFKKVNVFAEDLNSFVTY